MKRCERISKAFECSAAIVFSTNDSFAKYLSAMLQSIIDHSRLEKNYDIVILTSDMADSTFVRLLDMVRDRENFSLRRFQVNEIIENYAFFTANVDRLSQETYYRLLIPELFQDYERVIYLDGDMVARVDIADLYEIPFEGNSLISSRDMNGVMYCHSDYEDGIERAQYRKELMAPNDPDDYIIAGLLVFNIDIVKRYSSEELLTLAASREWLQHDQDVINYLFAGKTKLIHAKWDFLHEVNRHHIGYLPKSLQKEYYEAETDPFIVHYGGNRKPWNSWYVQNDLLFWEAVKKTPFFNEVFFGMKWKIEYKAYIIRHLFGDEFEELDKEDRLWFSYFGKELGDYNQTISVHFCSIHDEVFELEGMLPKVGLRSSDKVKVFLQDDQRIFSSLESTLQTEWFRSEGDLKWEGLSFRFVVPLAVMSKVEILALVYSVNGRYYQSQNFSFGRHCAIGDEIRSSYQNAEGKVLSFKGSCFYIVDACAEELKSKEDAFLDDLSYWKCYEEVKTLRSRNAFIEKCEKPIWIFADSVGVRKGSAEVLFEYACKHEEQWGIVPILITDSNRKEECDSYAAGSVAVKGSYVFRDSVEHKALFLKCAYCFTSATLSEDFNPFAKCYSPYRDRICGKKIVHISHSEISTDLSCRLNRSEFNPWLLTVFSARECASIIENQKYSLNQSFVKETGIPRYDELREAQEKVVLILPAKRRYLMRDIGKCSEKPIWVTKRFFNESDYFLFYNSLINDSRFIEKAKECDYSIRFLYHHEMEDSIRCFEYDPEVVSFHSFDEYCGLFPMVKLFITDYSSLQSDAAALRKPIIYARFYELEACYDEHPFGLEIYDVEKDGFASVLKTKDEVVSTAISFMENSCSLDSDILERLERNYPATCFESACVRVFRALGDREQERCPAEASVFETVDDKSVRITIQEKGLELTQEARKRKLLQACQAIGLSLGTDRAILHKNRLFWGSEISTALSIKKGPNVVIGRRPPSTFHAPNFVDCEIGDWCLMFLGFLAFRAFESIPCNAISWDRTNPRWSFGQGWRVVAEASKYEGYEAGDVVSFNNGKSAIVYDVKEGFVSFVQANICKGVCVVRVGGLSGGPFMEKATRISKLPRVNWVIRKMYL